MRKYWIKYLLIFGGLLIISCGSGRKLAQNPQVLGYVPFAGEKMAGPVEEVNNTLRSGLEGSGSFIIRSLDSVAAVWDLPKMQEVRDSAQWILTGELVNERLGPRKGRKIPFLLYTPGTAFSVTVRYRLYSREKSGWQDIAEVTAEKKVSGDLQFVDYDASDPSLILDAKERQLLREKTYERLARKLTEILEKQMNIN